MVGLERVGASAVMDLDQILRFAVKHGISDVHLKVGKPPRFRKEGRLVVQKGVPSATSEDVRRWFSSVANERIAQEFQNEKEVDFSFGIKGCGRFRANVFLQRDTVAMVLRHIPPVVLSVRDLHLPEVLEQVAMYPRGMVLVTGATGSGKSTTLAAMIDHINNHRAAHVITIEDPIEFVFSDKQSIVNQRQVGTDTQSFPRALRSALRQDPDVVLIGELRDLETMETALHAAETGHLVLSTLHTVDAMETISRIIGMFPPHQQLQVRLQLSTIIKAVVSQRLVRKNDGTRVAACEIMIGTEFIKELIADPHRTHEIPHAISQGRAAYQMQTFDQALIDLWKDGLITTQEAMANATNPAEIKMHTEGIG